MLIGPLGTNVCKILNQNTKISSVKWRPFCLNRNVLRNLLDILLDIQMLHLWHITPSHCQGWGQIRFIKYKYKYKYKNLDFSNTNTNTNIFFNFDSNTNTNTNTSIQIQIQIRSTKYICRNGSGSKIGQFYKSQDTCICSWPVFPYVSVTLEVYPFAFSANFTGTGAGGGVLGWWIGMLSTTRSQI